MDAVWNRLNRLHDGLLVMVLLAVTLVSGYGLCDSLYIYAHIPGSQLLQYKPDSPDYDEETSPITDEMVGWVTLDDTTVDYPIMQGESNITFLNKDPFGNFSLSGSIFLDSRCDPAFEDEYALIYGHHMEYGQMFGALDAYLDEDYARAHRNGTLLIGRDGERRCQLTVLAVIKTSAEERALFDVTHPARTRRYIAAHAQIQFAAPTDRMLALSTCAEESETARILVLCDVRE